MVPLLLEPQMLSLPNDGRYPALDLDPQQRRQKTLKALVWQPEALTQADFLFPPDAAG
jgi:hypothetical protein